MTRILAATGLTTAAYLAAAATVLGDCPPVTGGFHADCTLAVPGNAVTSFTPLADGKVPFSGPSGVVGDFRAWPIIKPAPVVNTGRTGVDAASPGDLRTVGVKVQGQCARDRPWHLMKQLVNGQECDGDGINHSDVNGIVHVQNAWFDNVMDGISIGSGPNSFKICGVYAKETRDDFIEDDGCKDGTVRNVLVDGSHMFFSARRGNQAADPTCTPAVTVEDSVIGLRCGPYTQDVGGAKDPNSCNGTTTGVGSFFKTGPGGPTVTCKNTVFMTPSKNEGGTGQMDFPPGSYTNCKLVWLGGGAYPGVVRPGLTVSTNKADYDAARSVWLARNGCPEAGCTAPPTSGQ